MSDSQNIESNNIIIEEVSLPEAIEALNRNLPNSGPLKDLLMKIKEELDMIIPLTQI